MTEQESVNMETQRKLAMQDAKFAMFMQELQQQREDIRRIQAKHDADMRDAQIRHDADMRAAQAKHDADMRDAQAKHDADMLAAREKHDADMREAQAKHNDDMKAISKQLHDNFVQTLLGVGGMIVALGALLITTLK